MGTETVVESAPAARSNSPFLRQLPGRDYVDEVSTNLVSEWTLALESLHDMNSSNWSHCMTMH